MTLAGFAIKLGTSDARKINSDRCSIFIITKVLIAHEAHRGTRKHSNINKTLSEFRILRGNIQFKTVPILSY